ncbi:MAG: cohesin domain-containing protein [Pyrinomonadaceae bacterium]
MKNFILSALALLIIGVGTNALSRAIVPVNGVTPTLTSVTVNNGAGDQYDPHVSGEWAAYTSDLSIRYYSFATNTDAAIPLGISARDLLSDTSGGKIVFSRVVTGIKTAIMVFDASTAAAPIEIDAADGVTRIGSAIGGNTVAYIDFTLESHGELVIHDLVTSTSIRITNDTALDANPSVSPDGTVVTWEHCATSSSNCDIWQAVRTGPVWNVSTASGTSDPEANPDNNGTLVVYDSTRAANADIYWRLVSGGSEVQLQMSGFEANPSIAGNFICFESRPTLFETTDIFVYDIATNLLYKITDTPLVTEQLNDITVLPDGRVRVVWTTDEDGFDQRNVKAAAFTLSPAVPNGKIAYTNGGDIWKMDPDGSNRQLVIDAGTNDIEPEWSPDGTKIAFKSDRDVPPGRGVYSVNADGTGLTLLTNGGINNSDSSPTGSPDGSRIAFSSNRDGLIPSIYIMNADGSNVTRLTNQFPYSDAGPEWSPDGKRMIFETNQGLCSCIGIINLDGTGRTVIGSGQFPSWSPDGTKIIFALLTQTGYHINTMNPDGTGITQLTFGAPNDQYPSFSPDGQKIVFARNTSGTMGLWTMNADGSNQVIFPGTNTIGNGYSDWGILAVAPAITGTVTYGNAIPAAVRFVSNVLISGAGSVPVSVFTDGLGPTAGQYSLTGFGAGAYTVTPTKTGGVNSSIGSFDAARIAQHAAGSPLPQLTGNQLLVADVSNNGSITAFDAAMVAKYAVGPPYEPPGIGLTGTWKFVPDSRNYASVSSNVTGEDYSALLVGEVSGNWVNTGARPEGGGAAESDLDASRKGGAFPLIGRQSPGLLKRERSFAVDLPKIVTSVEKEIVIPVNVQGVSNKGFISYEFDLRFDPSVVQPSPEPVDLSGTVSQGLSVVTNASEPGLLRIVVYGAFPIDSDGVLLNLRFTAVGAVGSVSALVFERIIFNEDEPGVSVTDGRVEVLARSE